MYVATIPNRGSNPTILLRTSIRKGEKVHTKTLANITSWNPGRIEALKRALRGEFDNIGDVSEGVSDKIFGVLFVLKEIASHLGIKDALGKGRLGKLSLFLVLSRIAHQGSRLSTVRWAKNHAVMETLGLTEFNENDLYEALSYLDKNQEALEIKLYKKYVKEKGSPPVLVLYDVTSSYFEGDCNELAEYGYNRDGKKGKKQIVIGLLTGDDGEPLAVRVFEGNTSDSTTVSIQIGLLKEKFKVDEVVFVGDRGMVKTKGKMALNEKELKYITALTDPQIRKLLKKNIIQLDLFEKDIADVEHDGVRLIMKCNEKVRVKKSLRREKKLERLMELIEERNRFVESSKRADPEAGLKRLSQWVSRYKLSSFVSLELKDRELVFNMDDEGKRDAAMLDGCYVLETDVPQDKMAAPVVDARYHDLSKVESDFKTLKTGFLEVRPIFVRKADRTRGHVFASMLALKIVREIRNKLKDAFNTTDENRYAVTLNDALVALSRICFWLYEVDGKKIMRLPMLDKLQSDIFDALGIEILSNKNIPIKTKQLNCRYTQCRQKSYST